MSPDGALLASSDSEGVINLWDVESGREICSLNSHIKYQFFIAVSLMARSSLLAEQVER